MSKAAELVKLGQSAWMDSIRRGWLPNELLRMSREDGVRGVTSNPNIFEKAIASTGDYDRELATLAKTNADANTIYETLAISDITRACDLLRPLLDEKPKDGFVSLEVSPRLANDTAGTIAEARRFWKAVDRPNVLIKIPATEAGLPAIQQAIAEGISVNVTLLFSVNVYENVMVAYIAGLEDRVARGLPIAQIHSVASFFVSRVDTSVDKELERIGTPEAKALLGKIAVANAKVANERFAKIFSGPRWDKLAAKGANIQRVLWASTGTKSKAYSDILYVQELIGPNSVNTMPEATLKAFNDHGEVRRTVDVNVAEAHAQLAAIEKMGISLEKICTVLTKDGVDLFDKAFTQLLSVIEQKRNCQ